MKIQKWVTKLTNHYLIKIYHVSKSAIFENIKSIFIGILSKSAVFDRQRKKNQPRPQGRGFVSLFTLQCRGGTG